MVDQMKGMVKRTPNGILLSDEVWNPNVYEDKVKLLQSILMHIVIRDIRMKSIDFYDQKG